MALTRSRFSGFWRHAARTHEARTLVPLHSTVGRSIGKTTALHKPCKPRVSKAFSALGQQLEPLTQDACLFHEHKVMLAEQGGAVVFDETRFRPSKAAGLLNLKETPKARWPGLLPLLRRSILKT